MKDNYNKQSLNAKLIKMRKYSICITALKLNEQCKRLLESLKLEAGSELVVFFKEKSDISFKPKLLNYFSKVKKCSRSEGRNLCVSKARNNIIVMTDTGCIPDRNWLTEITRPFKDPDVDIVAGFYIMKAETRFQKAASVFLGVLPQDFDENFIPSARSVAFRKSIWKKVGGFPEELKDTAEDTIFFQRAIEAGAKIVRVKKAIVYWEVPNTVGEYFNKISNYAKGDAQSRVFWHPLKKLKTHNIIALLVVIRYLAVLALVVINWKLSLLLLFGYTIYGAVKIISTLGLLQAGIWSIVFQIYTDFAIIKGFCEGLFLTMRDKKDA